MDNSIQKGYLVIADISGYTEYLASSELDHAPNILRSILDLLVKHLTPTMQLAEVEGDAVFVYAPESRFSRGELLLELIESAYIAFKDRQRTSVHNATCPCKACLSINKLDLKFVVHHGEFALHDFDGHQKPVGTSVNLVHRLLKNSVAEKTGWSGYALLSGSCLDGMCLREEELHWGTEEYEHLGTVKTASFDLHRRYHEITDTRRVVLDPTDADMVINHDFTAPPPIIWDWLNDPHKRNIWNKGAIWEPVARPNGRTGPVAQNHCLASKFLEQIIDWQPFHYYTVHYVRRPLDFIITGELTQKEEGTSLSWRIKQNGSMPQWMKKSVSRLLVNYLMKTESRFEVLETMTKPPPLPETMRAEQKVASLIGETTTA